ncbi:lipopolysaccharide biosynthesis protein, partial [Prevotella sp.]|uniref:lipopolysaccharide biosynthesis protein n=1 Tax=Prevotella sp. TaxID=59823 RepID=UPI00264F547A|nr:hypothetical protein [Prevotella sp.]
MFKQGIDARSYKIYKNLVVMFLLKGATILIGLLLVPLTVDYVKQDDYGVWLTISSIIGWMAYFDIGINNGLKNKFSEYKAKGDIIKVRQYVSTAYFMLICIFIPLMFLLLIANIFIDWNMILNVQINNMNTTMAILIAYFCINFILSTINIVLMADQRPGGASFISFLTQLASLIIIFVLKQLTGGSLILLSLALCIPTLLVILIFNIILYGGKY